jgi:hypothetical protein
MLREGGVALILATALSLAACAGPSYTYVSSASTRTYFRVPSRWRLFTKQQLLVAANLQDSAQASNSFPFLAGYDAAPRPSIDHVLALSTIPQYPVMMARVVRLSASGHDQLSVSALRNSVYPVDQAIQNDAADILSYKEVVLSGGYHGVRMVYNLSLEGNLTIAAGNQVMRVAQVSLVDPATSLLYVLLVRCSAQCYKSNQTAIDQITSSFTVRAH